MDIHTQTDAYVLHDGRTILDVNAAFCRLFRCERDQAIDRSLFDLVFDDQLQNLGRLRMRILIESGRQLPDVLYSFLRFDDTVFWGEGHTISVGDGQQYQSHIKLLHEA